MSPVRYSSLTSCVAAILFAIATCCAGSYAQTTKVLAPHKPVGAKLAKPLPLPPPVPGSMVGGPWMVDGNFKSSIYLKNSVETLPVMVTPVLYLSNGVRYALPSVQLEPSGTAVVDINAALQGLGIAPYATLSGYVEITYNWPWDPICATIRNLDTAHSLLFTYNLRSTKPFQLPNQPAPSSMAMKNVLEGMWWKQEPNVTGFVALANTTAQPMAAEVAVSDNLGKALKHHAVEISPHGMKTVSLDELSAATTLEGGIRVTYTGQMTDLVINGGLQDQAVGYSVGLPLAYASMGSATSKASVAELGLMTGAADPMMQFPAGIVFTPYAIVRNISGSPLTATPTIWWMASGAAQSFQLPAVSLLPYQSQTLKVPALLAAAGLKNFAGTVHLVFDVQENADSLMVAGGSVDQTNNYVFSITSRGITESGARSLSYWSTANGDDTMVTLWNPADEAQDFLFTATFVGGEYNLPIHLEPRATRIFNMSEIGQIPDAGGNIIPAGVHEGGAKISGAQGDNQSILVGMDAGTYNIRKATCGQFCHGCLGEVSHTISPGTFSLPIGGTQQLSFYAVYNNGQDYADAGTWSSSNTSVAGVDSISGVVGAVGPGSATITAQTNGSPDPQFVSSWCEGVHWACPLDYIGGSATASGTVLDATPVITGIDPSDWVAGNSQSVTFSGQNFGTNAPALNFSPSGGISYTLSSYNDSQIVANVTVAAGTPNEDVSVTVTNNGYGGNPFNGGSVGQTPTSPSVNATVRAIIASQPEITVIAWVDGTAPDLNPLPSGANQNLVTHLNSSAASCGIEVGLWVVGSPVDILTQTDQNYANGWLVKYSANPTPPNTITPSTQLSAGNFRLFNDFGGSSLNNAVQVGRTPDPCGIDFGSNTVKNWISAGQSSPYMGAYGTSGSGKVYQLAEGRIGKAGQAGSQTINAGRTVPWIWSDIEFDANGNPYYSDVAIFPTYSVYKNGVLVETIHQSAVATFIALDSNYQRIPSDIP